MSSYKTIKAKVRAGEQPSVRSINKAIEHQLGVVCVYAASFTKLTRLYYWRELTENSYQTARGPWPPIRGYCADSGLLGCQRSQF